MPSGSSTKQSAARQARLEREAAERVKEERKKRLAILGGALGVVVLVIVVVLAAGVFKKDPAQDASSVDGVTGVTETRQLFAGIPQNGITLGNPNAPATIVEFADLKCPFCKQQALTTQPKLIPDLVRTGKANMQLQLISVIDQNVGTTDGAAARTTAFNLAATNKFWTFSHLAYFNQGEETSVWATPSVLAKLVKAAGVTTSVSSRQTPASRELTKNADTLQSQLKVSGTPSIFVKPRGVGEYQPVSNPNDVSAISSAVAAATKKAKSATATR